MSPYLLDANVLIASVFADHDHFSRADDWIADAPSIAVCPVVEGALVRFALRLGESGASALSIPRTVRLNPRCEFWPDDVSYADVDLSGLTGHRQTTDAYLAALARSRHARLVTFDGGLAREWPDSTLLIP